ncbi:LacI family DNA-binding transcriptional regulator [Proteiniborus sp. MB09-C3]|uniref:LacI family DNA-binding transcriptional regulator n=1 Tax=Proteiniborus sp. MB09-C3 TaxID=3050072 RepID=UPI002554B670|nr:LacI family DNA-binding transcriptional regulator [Proteiniborus sp. MB09-C3]WIV11638.1 LacI family DNA-binding transcriptional regulator [Proteiniborus sp. MB09-C3]
MEITIYDVAEKAGVSITTVSRAINNNYPVKEETRKKIEEAIEELGYVPNEIARSLILKSTSSVGIVVPGITNLFFPTIVEEINRVLVSSGFTMSLYITEGDTEREKVVVDSIISRNMDGIIAIDPSMENLENNYFPNLSEKIPIIIINGNTNKYKCNFISYDEEVGTKEAFKHLLQLGHREIAFVRGDRSLSYDLKEDLYRQFVKDNNLNYEKIISVGMGNSLEVVKKTEAICREFINSKDRGTAIFACNDLMAVGVINACNKAKVKVPEDMSVIGFDNTLLSSVNHPKITTVDLNMQEIGKNSASVLIDMIKGKHTKTKKVVYNTKLIVKESCGKRK